MFKKELTRALFNKRIGFVIFLSFGLLYLSAYMSFLDSHYFIDRTAEDLTPEALSTILAIGGNTYHIWTQSYSLMQMLFVLAAVFPFTASYVYEKKMGFDNLMIIRSGHVKYRLSKLLATSIAGGMALLIPSALYFCTISVFFENRILSPFAFQPEGLFSDIFSQSPQTYIGMVFIMHFILGFSIAAFAMGITSFFSKIVLVYVIPFAIYLTFDIFISNTDGLEKYALTPMYYLMSSRGVELIDFIIVNVSLILIGVTAFFINYKWELHYGS